MKRRKAARLVAGVLLLVSGCSTDGVADRGVVSYDLGPDWTRSDEILPLGVTTFDQVAKHGLSRCVNTDLRDGLLASGLVTGAATVDEALTRVLGAGLVTRLFGPQAGAIGGVAHDIAAGTVRGRRATIAVVAAPCVPFDLNTASDRITLDLLGFPAGGDRNVVVVFLGGTMDEPARRPILDSIRVTS